MLFHIPTRESGLLFVSLSAAMSVGVDLYSFRPALHPHAVLSERRPEGNVCIVPYYFSMHAACLLDCQPKCQSASQVTTREL